MPGDASRREDSSEGVRPGSLSALLRDLAAAPEASPWDGGLPPGTVVGRFEIVRELGRGGFGVVYEARDRELGRSVAFKAVRASADAALREERLLREAETAARLSHPNIVHLYDVGRCEHGPYLVLELLRGRTLQARLDEGPLPPDEALRVAREVARGVAHAHAEGVVHRDLKPANVFLCDDGQVKVLDFGLAHAFGRRRQDGGTPAYMAPEQWRGAPEDERTDVFALGVMLYRMLSGALPFPDDGGRTACSDDAPPALEIPAAPALAAVVSRMLAKDPVARPRDTGEVAAALEAASGELARSGGAEVRAARRRPAPRRRARGAWLAGGVAIAIAFGAGALLRHRAHPPTATTADGRVMVAVADVVNETGDPELDGLSGLLITSLEQSRKLQVLTRTRMLDLARQAGHRDVRRIDEVLGREVGRGAGARALLVAAVHRLGDAYALELRAIDPAKDEYLFTLTERTAAKPGLLDVIDRVSERSRLALREDAAAVSGAQAPVAAMVTTNLGAYEHYFLGLERFDQHRFNDALSEFRRALELDPQLALAHLWIAFMAAYNTAGSEQAEPHLAIASRSSAVLPAKERRLVAALSALLEQRMEEARAGFRALMADFPQEKLFPYFSAHASYDVPERIRLFRRALELDPSYPWALYELAFELDRTGEAGALLPAARRAVTLRPGFTARFNLALVTGLTGDAEGALAQLRDALAGTEEQHVEGISLASAALVALGRRDEAERMLRPWIAPPASDADRHLAATQLMLILGLEGRRAEAVQVASRAPGPNNRWGTLLQAEQRGIGGDHAALRAALEAMPAVPAAAAQALADEGLAARVEEALARTPADYPGRALAAAAAARRAGEPAEAARRYRAAFGDGRDAEEAYLVGEALAAGGDCAAALPELERVDRRLPWVWFQPTLGIRLPLALLEAARCEARLGRPDAARARLDRLLALWKGADPDLPALAEARALRRRLPASARPGPGAAR